MAYLPPHKRHSNSKDSTSLSSSFQSLSLSSSSSPGRRRDRSAPASGGGGGKIVYATGSISRWWATPAAAVANGDGSLLRLETFPCEEIERKSGAKPLALAVSGGDGAGAGAGAEVVEIAERVVPDLVAAAAAVAEATPEVVGKMSVVARIGKVLFHGGSSVSLDSILKAAVAEEGLKNQVHKSMYTNVPKEYMKDIEHSVEEKMGLALDSSKEYYHVKVFDKNQADSTISCKCTVRESGGLGIHKIELNTVRYMVADISCLFKDLDLRLMLSTKKILQDLDVEVVDSVNKLISSAIIDPNAKGGLRWPLGKDSVGERFSIVAVWHTNYKAFRDEMLRLKLRHAKRFNHRTSVGEVSNEVTLKLTAISQKLRDGNLEAGPLQEMVESTVQMIWDNLLSYKKTSTSDAGKNTNAELLLSNG